MMRNLKETDIAMIVNDKTLFDYQDRLRMLATSLFNWTGLDEIAGTGASRFLEQVLFEDGRACFVQDSELGFMALRCNPNDKYNVYNLPTRVTAFSFQYNKQYDDKVIEIHNLSENGINSFELNYDNPNIFIFGYYAFVAKNASGKKHIEQLKQMSYSSVDPSYINNVLNSLDYNTTVNTYSRNSIINLLKSGIHPVLYAYKNKAKLEFDDLPGDWKVVKVGKEKNDTQFVLLGHDVEIPDSELLIFDSVDRLQGLKNRLERVISKIERDSNIIETVQSNLKDIDNFSSMKQVTSLFNIDDMSQINDTTINDLVKLIISAVKKY